MVKKINNKYFAIPITLWNLHMHQTINTNCMSKMIWLTLFLCTCICFSFAQTTTDFYADRFLHKKVTEKKAKFIHHKTTNKESGIYSEETIRISDNEIIRRESYKGQEPVGQWIEMLGKDLVQLDYDFELMYGKIDICEDKQQTFIPKTNDVFIDPLTDIPELKYKAPEEEISIKEAMVKMHYPYKAVDEGIMGTVFVHFRVASDGTISYVVVSKGIHPLIDKEAMRIMKQVKFKSPPLVDGKPVAICVAQQLHFKLE
jgi:TonB family protein